VKKLLNNKRGGSQNNGALLVVIIVIGLIVWGVYTGKIPLGKTTTETTVTTPVAEGCYVTKSSVTVGARNAYVPATSPTNGYNMIWTAALKADGTYGAYVKLGSYAQDDTISLSPGTKIKVLFVENSTTYYGKVVEYVIPCDGTLNIKEKVYAMADYADITTTVWNDDGTVNENDGAKVITNVTYTAGGSKNIEFRIIGDFQKAIGNPELSNNVLSCKMNQTAYDEEITTLDGASSIANPGLLTGATGMTYKSFAFPILKSNAEKKSILSFKADDTYVPTFVGAGDVYCILLDPDYDVDADTDAIISGVVDEDQNDLGLTSQNNINFTIRVQ